MAVKFRFYYFTLMLTVKIVTVDDFYSKVTPLIASFPYIYKYYKKIE